MPPTQVSGDVRHGFVYQRVPHVTLGSIARNPEIRSGLSRGEKDAVIKRNADLEYLYDKPYVDKHRVRVSGPFTVESLSPHRSLAFEPAAEPDTETEATRDADAQTFEQTILENLAKASITVDGRIDLVTRLETDEVSIVDFTSTARAQEEEVTPDQLLVYAAGYQELTGSDADVVEILNLDEGGKSVREKSRTRSSHWDPRRDPQCQRVAHRPRHAPLPCRDGSDRSRPRCRAACDPRAGRRDPEVARSVRPPPVKSSVERQRGRDSTLS